MTPSKNKKQNPNKTDKTLEKHTHPKKNKNNDTIKNPCIVISYPNFLFLQLRFNCSLAIRWEFRIILLCKYK